LIGSIAIAGSASAATVSIGSYSFDDRAFADTVSSAQGSVSHINNIIDQDFFTWGTIGTGDVLQFGFTNNRVFNGVGDDILVVERRAPENQLMSLTFGGVTLMGTLRESVFPDERSLFGFDLSDLGVALGAKLTHDLFLQPSGNNSPGVSAIVALNTTPVPLPASLALLSGGLGLLALTRRRRRTTV
jgi:hypothetical protein